MKINKLYIKNFRNYIGEHEFDLSKKLLFYLGKMDMEKVLFDAVEWCLSNSISRFSQSKIDNLKEDLMNRYAPEGSECKVILEFEKFKLVRAFGYEEGKYGNIQTKITNLKNEVILDEFGNEINTIQRVNDHLINNFEKNFLRVKTLDI
ncbi:hypothetical protein ACT7DA_11220 [Bacillus pacificus]